MANFRQQRKERNRLRYSRMGKRSQEVQRERRMADITSEDIADPPPTIGSLQWHDFRTGKVHRWTVLRGDRIDQVILRAPDGRQTQPHGWTWIMDHLRGYLAGRKV